jgi:hypothetical protein
VRVGWVLGGCREPDCFFVADEQSVAFVLTRVCSRLGRLMLTRRLVGSSQKKTLDIAMAI